MKASTVLQAVLLLGGAGLTALLGAALFVWSGLYDVAATVQHTQPVFWLLETTMHQSVQRQARNIAVPPLAGSGRVERGAACYRAHCVSCHGGPGTAQDGPGRSMQPLPGPLVDATRHWRPAELYWILRHGIRMSGMPAWQHRLSDEELWALVAFLQQLPGLTAAEFSAQTQAGGDRCEAAAAAPAPARPPDPRLGRIALTQYACSACHRIPGVTGAAVQVGPPLAGIARRGLIAGVLPNTPENMQRWIRDPRGVSPQTTMPDLEVGERDARDIAAYLATLH